MFIFSGTISAQQFYLKIIGQNEKETKQIDSLGYVLKHQNTKSIVDENNLFYEKLSQNGYLESQLIDNLKQNDSTFYFKYKLGKRTNYAHL